MRDALAFWRAVARIQVETAVTIAMCWVSLPIAIAVELRRDHVTVRPCIRPVIL